MTEAERLAQGLEKHIYNDDKKAAALLRSQAAEIFALKSEVLNKADYAKSMYLMHEASKAEIERLRSQKQFVEGQHAKPSQVYDITGAEPPPPNSGFARLGEFE